MGDVVRTTIRRAKEAWVYCEYCESLTHGEPRSWLLRTRRAGLQRDRLGVIQCQRCGTVLPPLDTGEAMLRKLSQLAQFGIGAGAGPLLTPGED